MPSVSSTEAAVASFRIVSESPEQTGELARVLARQLAAGDTVLLTGPLASGKTTFVKAVTAALGSDQLVTSPTFTLAQFYPTPTTTVMHVDAYRLEDLTEYRDLGLDEYAETCVNLVEWGEKVAGEFPCHLSLRLIAPGGDAQRREVVLASGCPRWTAVLPRLREEMLAAVPS